MDRLRDKRVAGPKARPGGVRLACWRVPLPGKGWSSPVLSCGRLYLTTAVPGPETLSLRALCLDALDGRLVWNVEVASRAPGSVQRGHSKHGDASSTPVLRGDRLYVHFGYLGTAALDLSGKMLWRSTELDFPSFAHGLLFVSSGFDHPVLLAIRPEGAVGDVTETRVAWRSSRGAPLTPSMVVVGGEIYFVSDAGVATCADARTGAAHWSERSGGNFSASPVSAEGRVYFQNEAGMGFVLKCGKTFEVLARNDLGERPLASCAVAEGALFIRSEGHLWRVGSTGSRWL